ncbi:MAG TPA: hypothetical protein VGK41_00995 [Solirubrobacterales bacterium]
MITPRKYDLLKDLGSRRELTASLPTAGGAGGGLSWGLVTSLPSAPAVGDTCIYKADATNGVFWQLVYDGVGGTPWKAMGPGALFARDNGQSSRTSNVYGDLAAGATPAIVLPLAGDYVVQFGARVVNGPESQDIFMSVSSADTEAVKWWYDSGHSHTTGSTSVKRTGLAAAATIAAKYRTAAGGACTWEQRWLAVTPIRVG